LRVGFALPLVALAIAIGCYVAAEIGVSSWLVRFLGSAPLTTATGALSLFWLGLTLGRLMSAVLGDRFDHLRFAVIAAFVSGVALFGAVVVPDLTVSIALLAVVGFAFGPVYPLIMTVAGQRFPGRAATQRAPQAAHRRHRQRRLPPIGVRLEAQLGHRRRDVAGRHAVDPDTAGRPFRRQRAGELDDPGLRRVVGGLRLGHVDDRARHRGDVDD